ncbi:RNase H domain-containing protein [Trichonephila clavipes]|nr:RNase H domain-containing protein [Trichonephila clavipes]
MPFNPLTGKHGKFRQCKDASKMDCTDFSAFKSELIDISGAPDHAVNSYKASIWILTDSRSSIQYLKNWPKIMDSTGLDILSKLIRLGQRKQVCLQWIPSHVGVPGNKAADELAGKGCDLPNPSSTVLTHTEIHSFQRNKMNLTWRNPPAHHWYAAKSPELSIQCKSSRAHQTALARFRSGHLHRNGFLRNLGVPQVNGLYGGRSCILAQLVGQSELKTLPPEL